MTDNAAQKAADAYRLAALDRDFLLSDSMRGVRFLLEYAKAEEHLRDWGIRSTIVVFGSARVGPGQISPDGTTESHGPRSARWYEEARRFGRIVSERGGAMKRGPDGLRDNVIATGGGPGIMEAANRGAAEAGAPSIGFNIHLPEEQEPNAYTNPELTFRFHYFAMRKMHLAMRAAALVIFPGGFGTLDEFLDILTLMQTGKMQKVPIVCCDRAYWREVINLDLLVAEGMISADDCAMLNWAESAEQAWEQLVAAGLTIPPDRGVQPRPDVAP